MALAALFEADDAVHDCLIQALRNWQQFRPGTDLRAWLITLDVKRRVTGLMSRDSVDKS